MEGNTDIQVDASGGVFYVTPISPEGREWIDENVQSEPWQWTGASLAVDHGYAADIVLGMRADGLTVSTAFCYF